MPTFECWDMPYSKAEPSSYLWNDKNKHQKPPTHFVTCLCLYRNLTVDRSMQWRSLARCGYALFLIIERRRYWPCSVSSVLGINILTRMGSTFPSNTFGSTVVRVPQYLLVKLLSASARFPPSLSLYSNLTQGLCWIQCILNFNVKLFI